MDCRWLGIGGPGRTTEFVLRGLAQEPPSQWVLWGAEHRIRPLAWPDAEVAPIGADPRRLLGQRHAFAVPAGDLVVFMHQVRPLRSVPSITLIYDTIPLRHGVRGPARQLKRLFLARVASTSSRIMTISNYSKESIARDLKVAKERVDVLRFPFAEDMADRVLALRPSLPKSDVALFVGGFLPHKNLPRLVHAFADTSFRRNGGRLVLAGGTSNQAQRLIGQLTPEQRTFVNVREVCSQPDLDRLLASSLFLVQPSLEEGFGLPAWEALCCGLPVCSSDGGALPEVVRGFAEPFDPSSVPNMSKAIDECAAQAQAAPAASGVAISDRLRRSAPTVRDFGEQFRSVVERQVNAV